MTTSSTTSATTSAITGATQQLLSSLGTGSGVDTDTLVSSLVKAEFAAKNDALIAKAAQLTTQISGVSSLKSAVAGFASALQTLSTGGALSTQPVSSNTGVLTAAALPGAKLAGLASSIQVSRLAAAQTARTADGHAFSRRGAAQFTGTLTLSVGTPDANGAINDAAAATLSFPQSATLDQVAGAINAAAKGVSASVVTDANGAAYLSLKGQEGAAHAFTLTTDGDPSLADLAVGAGASGTTITNSAADAALSVDGIAVTRGANTIADLVAGVKLQLTGVSADPVALTATAPTATLSQAVTNFVDTYNQMLSTVTGLTDPKTGALKDDSAAQTLLRSLKGLTGTPVLTGAAVEPGGPTRLSELGVATNRDGTLRVDTATLTRQLARFPASAEAMFAYAQGSTDGLPAALNSIATRAASTITGLGASATRYAKAQTDVSDQQDKLSTRSDAEKTRLTQQFAGMNAKVAAYKSTQTFLKNQVDAWNNQNN